MTLLHQAAQKAVEALKQPEGDWSLSAALAVMNEVRDQLESALQHQEVPREPVAVWQSQCKDGTWADCTEANARAGERYGFAARALYASPSTTRQQEVGSGPVHVHESCWLIEATAPPRPLYYAGPKRGGRRNRTLSEVTEDAGRAIRFPTEDAAKLTIALICGIYTDDATWPLRLMNSGWKATEHIFDYTPLAAAPSTPEKAGGVPASIAQCDKCPDPARCAGDACVRGFVAHADGVIASDGGQKP